FVPTWEAMRPCVSNNKIRAISVNNFSTTVIRDLLFHAKSIPIVYNHDEFCRTSQ
ncbi:hypothetical protein K431DRAFT_220823, partial [Polychaeton citri CBS 116435]